MIKILELDIKGDERGSLISLEAPLVPFDILRTYFIFETSAEVVRGKHAHRNLEQILIAVSGSCLISTDNGFEQSQYELNTPNVGLYISGLVWREMSHFSTDCVLMVLASQKYDQSDYIHEYEIFKAEAKNART